VQFVARSRPLVGEVRLIRRFGPDFDALWRRVAPSFDFAVRRDSRYLQWKFVSPPHVRYTIAALVRDEAAHGYIVYRHTREPWGKVTLIADFLVDPADEAGLETLVRWVDREARAADSDKIRCFCMHAGFRKVLKREGYAQTASTLQFVAKINAEPLPPDFYTATDRWHVTLGDSDQDR
jgi:hypothetical protein